MTETRNILLIGRTGGGKSTLGNVLVNKNDKFEEVFTESAGGASETKEVEERTFELNIDEDGKEKIKYRVVDTIGLGDTNLTPQGVLIKLAEIASVVKRDGINQILFVIKGRFTKEEMETYDLLSSIIFDKDVLKYTTVVRVAFPCFEDEKKRTEDEEKLKKQSKKMEHILNQVKFVYIDNPPLEGESEMVKMAKKIREKSRKRILTYLGTCLDNYQPSNIDTLDERIKDYKTDEEKLEDKMKELEKARAEEADKFRKDMAELKEIQNKKIKELREEQDKKIYNLKTESEEKLRKTKNELEDEQRKKINELEEKRDKELKKLKAEQREEKEEMERNYKNLIESTKKMYEESISSLGKESKQTEEKNLKIENKGKNEHPTGSGSELRNDVYKHTMGIVDKGGEMVADFLPEPLKGVGRGAGKALLTPLGVTVALIEGAGGLFVTQPIEIITEGTKDIFRSLSGTAKAESEERQREIELAKDKEKTEQKKLEVEKLKLQAQIQQTPPK